MIAVTQMTMLGSELVIAGETWVYHSRSSGRTIFDVIVKGYSKNFTVVDVDDSMGLIKIPEVLERGDLVQVLFRMFPEIPVAQVAEFAASDFSNEFNI